MANRPRKRLDAPALFEDLELDDTNEPMSTDDSSGLDRLVTKVSSRPKSWSMKWRPDETKAIDDSEADRHPARGGAAGSETTPGLAEPTAMMPDDDATDLSRDAGETEASVPASSTEPILTSRTWEARSDAGARHPQMPSTTSAPVASPAARTAATPMRSVPTVRPRSPLARAGWPLAILLAIAWAGASLLRGNVDAPGASEPATGLAADPEAPILARPTEAELIEAELLRSELASMRDERARLMREVDAAYVLLQDHRRLSRELQESMATNKGASIEVDGLAEDLERWQRRHAVALERLDEMDQELVRSDEQLAALAAERDALRRRLDALEGTD